MNASVLCQACRLHAPDVNPFQALDFLFIIFKNKQTDSVSPKIRNNCPST